jgi:hypothetical protein
LGASLSLSAHSYLKTFPGKPINFRRAKGRNLSMYERTDYLQKKYISAKSHPMLTVRRQVLENKEIKQSSRTFITLSH